MRLTYVAKAAVASGRRRGGAVGDTLKDVLDVERELARVREEIERQEGRRRAGCRSSAPRGGA
ncbi:MAG: hypothetical protein ACREMN_11100 [Gemmatimonadales bacterium]